MCHGGNQTASSDAWHALYMPNDTKQIVGCPQITFHKIPQVTRLTE